MHRNPAGRSGFSLNPPGNTKGWVIAPPIFQRFSLTWAAHTHFSSIRNFRASRSCLVMPCRAIAVARYKAGTCFILWPCAHPEPCGGEAVAEQTGIKRAHLSARRRRVVQSVLTSHTTGEFMEEVVRCWHSRTSPTEFRSPESRKFRV